MASPGLSADRFVARSDELQVLRRALAEASRGHPCCVLVGGEPGIGKTRIAEEVVTALPPDRVVWGRCHETEGAPAYWPWIQVLRGLSRRRPFAERVAAATTTTPELGRLLPRPETAGVPADDGDPEAARFRLFTAVVALLREAGRDELLAIVLDDLQWADEESLLLLDCVAGELRDTRVLLLGTRRDTDPRTSEPARRLLAGLARVARVVPLGALTRDEVADLLIAHRVQAPAPDLAANVHRASGGNPFFVGEIAELVRRNGESAASSSRFRMPDTVREVIRRRLEPLPQSTCHLLAVIAVLGRDPFLDAMAAVLGVSAEEALQRLEPALRLGLVVETGRVGRYRLGHGLLQDALLADLPTIERAELHLRAGEALERLYAANLTPLFGELAHHFSQAAALGGLAKALDYAVRAGERARASLGFEEAAGHFRRALESEQVLGTDPARRFALLLKLADSQRWAGHEGNACTTLTEAARIAREKGDAVALARAAGDLARSRAETGTVDYGLAELLESALEELGSADSALRALTLGALSRILYFAPDRSRCERLSAEAVLVARRVGDRGTLASVLSDRHFALWHAGTEEERLALVDEILSDGDDVMRADLAAEARSWRILDLVELGRLSDADREIEAHAVAAARTRIPHLLWSAALFRAARALFDGRLADAEERCEEAGRTRAAHRLNNVMQFRAVQLFHIRLAQGRLEEFGGDLAAVTSSPGLPPIWRTGLAMMAAAQGNHEQARRIAEDLRHDDFAVLPRDSTWLGALAALAEVADAVGDAASGRAIYDQLLPHSGHLVVSGLCAVIHGSVDRFLGLAALAAGKPEQAVAHLERALEFVSSIGATAEVVRTQAALARALDARADPADPARSAALTAEAAHTARAIGAPGLVTGIHAGGVAAPAPRAVESTRVRASLRREGDYWTVGFRDELTRLKDTKGVGYLRHLLCRPGEEIHALELAGGGVSLGPGGDAGEAVDLQAARAYRRRLDELRRDIARGGANVDRLREEERVLEREVSRVVGLGGRLRRSSSDSERARLNVTRAISAVLKKIESSCPELAVHLKATLRTGTFCSYEPQPHSPVDWDAD